jgi:hypothetical protein
VSVGLEDAPDLIADFDRALAAARTAAQAAHSAVPAGV